MAETDGTNLMTLNANKAGMKGLDTEKINAIIEAASKGSKFYQAKQANQAKMDQRIHELVSQLADLSEDDINRARNYSDQLAAGFHRDLSRTIVHVDMDMFYAAVEMRDDPSLKDKPMAVGGNSMLSTSNYLARRFGVRAAMPGFIAKKLCPELVIVPSNMQKYAEVSEVVRGVFRQYDPNFAPMSLDEAYLDITEYLEKAEGGSVNAASVVNEMRGKIEAATGLTASAGIAPNLMLAKVGSDMNKPNGQYQLKAEVGEILEFVKTLPIRKVGGIGNVSEQMLKAIGVKMCSDLWEKRGEIKLLFSENSYHSFLRISLGLGCTRIEPVDERGPAKSISNETTFRETSDRAALIKICEELSVDLSKDMEKKGILGHAVTVKIKSHDYKNKSKVSQLIEDSNDADVIGCAAKKILLNLLDTSEEQPLKLRLMGVRMSELRDRNEAGSRKQKTLKNFLTAKSKRSSESVGQSEYECPVCGKGIKVEGIREFNQHLDNCLNGGASSNCDGSLKDEEGEMESNDVNSGPDCFKTETMQFGEDMEEEEDMFSENFCGDKVESDFEEEEEEIFANHLKEEALVNETINNNKEQYSPCLPCSQPEKFKSEFNSTQLPNSSTQRLENKANYSQLPSSSSAQRPHFTEVAQQRSLSTGSFFRQKMDQERANSPVSQSDRAHSPVTKSDRAHTPVTKSNVADVPEVKEVETFTENVSANEDETQLTCPVCLSGQVFISEQSLTRHVESCLSKQAINSMLRQENVSAKTDVGANVKLKRRMKDSRSCAEHATKKSTSKPIDSYFKRP